MKPEAQRIAIAEACGWKRLKTWCGHEWQDPQGRKGYQEAVVDGRDAHYVQPPDPLTDLNAMHEAEKILSPTKDERECCEGRWVAYGENLACVCGYEQHDQARFSWAMFHASAAQRAEAFLRTIGKWEE